MEFRLVIISTYWLLIEVFVSGPRMGIVTNASGHSPKITIRASAAIRRLVSGAFAAFFDCRIHVILHGAMCDQQLALLKLSYILLSAR